MACRKRLGRDLAGFARQADELDAAAEEFRRAAFVGRDMRLGMAQHRAPWRRQMGERQRIRGGAGRHQEDRDLVLENLGESSARPAWSRRPGRRRAPRPCSRPQWRREFRARSPPCCRLRNSCASPRAAGWAKARPCAPCPRVYRSAARATRAARRIARTRELRNGSAFAFAHPTPAGRDNGYPRRSRSRRVRPTSAPSGSRPNRHGRPTTSRARRRFASARS